MPKKLKFVQKGYETYSGPIGKFTFVDGVSTEEIHRVDRDTLSTAFQFVEIDADGTEQEAGVAARLVSDSAARMEYAGSLARQTEAEALVEQTHIEARKNPTSDTLHTRAQLEEIADKRGLKGLRAEVGDKWGVRNRSITLLIEEILVAQAKALEGRQIRIAPEGEAPAAPVADPIKSTVELGDDDAALLAAATGDMGAALNLENADAEPAVEEPAVDPAAEPADSAAADAAGDEGADAPADEGSEDGAEAGQGTDADDLAGDEPEVDAEAPETLDQDQ